jgi:Rps23 Pro-64 3,4-dihydroxylase Tpa1-like proline 4-hydroxylase
VVKRLVPKNNSLAFFEVTEKSFHQVAEVLTKDKQRLSVGEWKSEIVKEYVGKLYSYQVNDYSSTF